MMGGAEQSSGAENAASRYVRRATLTAEVLFQGKWKLQILCAMRSGPVRLGQLARIVPGASKKMLTQNLRQLEADGIVVRKDMSDLVLHRGRGCFKLAGIGGYSIPNLRLECSWTWRGNRVRRHRQML